MAALVDSRGPTIFFLLFFLSGQDFLWFWDLKKKTNLEAVKGYNNKGFTVPWKVLMMRKQHRTGYFPQ